MACGSCGKSTKRVQSGPRVKEEPQEGDYLVTYPNGETELFKLRAGQPSPRRKAAYAALASGGSYEIIAREPEPVAPRAARKGSRRKSEG